MPENGNGNGEKKRLVDLTAPLVMDLKTLVLLVPVIVFGVSIKLGQGEQVRVFEAYKVDQQRQMEELKRTQSQTTSDLKTAQEQQGKDLARRLDLQQFEINAIKLSLAEQGYRFKKGE